ncbi:hypothetical protein [Streptomyces sp. NPDC006925]|uniref:hypothetical protein n=1 Tax=Streptomyces sp. NPDC006925 TaxID=3364768 RepID=UPI0036770061
MTTRASQEKSTPTSATDAVLYVCAERSPTASTLADERASEEGHAYAERHGLRIVADVCDVYGEPDPCHREGWVWVREMAELGTIATVIVRWLAVIAPGSAHELRHREIEWLRERGVQVVYSWAPLASMTLGRP